jgi:glyoxylate/hydroxypyruvate reductase A
MSLLLAITGWEPEAWAERFRQEARGREIRLWPDIGDPAAVRYAAVWKPPPGVLASLPNLQAVFNLGAGVDALMADSSLPDVPVLRIVDADLTQRMTEYVVLHVLLHHRRQRAYDAQQRESCWRPIRQPAASEVRVGVMGLGVLGRDAAEVLARLGFRVAGWSRTPKPMPAIETFSGAELDAFLARTDILVCLLPLTPETRGILNRDLFAKLARDGALNGPFLVNAGRGGLQVEADIVEALDAGVLQGATLDVFETEPLPASSPLWRHPRVTVTPHVAADSDPRRLVRNVVRQIERHEAGLPFEHVVDRARGY